MTFVVYHVVSTQADRTYLAEYHARNRVRKLNHGSWAAYAYTTSANYFANVVKMKKVVNLMSGKEVEIPSNTPRCLDVSSELYWSM